MSSDVLRWVHTGAGAVDGIQRYAADCLGGNRANSLAPVLECRRPQPIAGVEVRYIAGPNGPGVGTITVQDADTVRWTAPGDTEGADATLTNGSDTVCYSNDTDKWVILRRTTADDLSGKENVQCLDVYNNAVANVDWTTAEATAGDDHYYGLIVKNTGSLSATAVKVWVDSAISGSVEIGIEATSSNAIQTIADRDTAPAAISFSAPTTKGTGLSIGTLTTGDDYGLWIKNKIAAAATSADQDDIILHYSFTYNGVDYDNGTLRGLRGTQNAAYYAGFRETSIPDPFTDTPKATGSTLPLTDVASLAQGTYYASTWYFSQYGVPKVVPNADGSEYTIIEIDSSGDQVTQPPSDAQDVEIVPSDGGKMNLRAVYHPYLEAEDPTTVATRRADTWIYEFTDDGTAVPASTWTEVAMNETGAVEELDVELAATLDNTPVAAIVRTRRQGTPDSDSTNTTEVSANSIAVGPSRPDRGRVTFGRAYASTFPTTKPYSGSTYTIANDWKFTTAPGSQILYHDTTLVWRALYDSENESAARLYIPNTTDLAEDAAAYTASGTTNYGLMGTSATVAYLYYMSDQSTEVKIIKLDVSANEIRFVGDINASYSALTEFPSADPGYERFQDTRFQIYDRATERHISYMSITPGEIYIRFPINQTLSAAAIEAL